MFIERERVLNKQAFNKELLCMICTCILYDPVECVKFYNFYLLIHYPRINAKLLFVKHVWRCGTRESVPVQTDAEIFR
jgi:hypothetical protein